MAHGFTTPDVGLGITNRARASPWRRLAGAGITMLVSTPAERVRSSAVSPEIHPELEELEDGAILAHETSAHLPQKRAQVTEEARSIVIAEQPAPEQKPFRIDRGEPTVVIERRELEAARKKILERRRRSGKGRPRPVLWAALAAAAFVGGGLLMFLSMRGSAGQPQLLGVSQAAPALNAMPESSPGAATSAGLSAQAEAERVPRKVSLEELPLERPRRRQ